MSGPGNLLALPKSGIITKAPEEDQSCLPLFLDPNPQTAVTETSQAVSTAKAKLATNPKSKVYQRQVVMATIRLTLAYQKLLDKHTLRDRVKDLKEYSSAVISVYKALEVYETIDDAQIYCYLAKIANFDVLPELQELAKYDDKKFPDFKGMQKTLSDTYYGKGLILHLFSKYEAALKLFKAALETDPENKDKEGFLKSTYLTLINSLPQSPQRTLYSAEAMELCGEKEKAINNYRLYLKQHPLLTPQQIKRIKAKITELSKSDK